MAMGEGDNPGICLTSGTGDQMALRDPDVDDSIRILLLKDLSHLARSKVAITRDDLLILPGELDEGAVMTGIHILLDISYLS